MSCGSEFHGQWGDDPAHDPMTHNPTLDEPVNIDGDSYPFPMPIDAPTDAEIAEWEYPGITNFGSQRGIPHTHAPGYDASREAIKDHLWLAHYHVTGRNPWTWHERLHPEGIQ